MSFLYFSSLTSMPGLPLWLSGMQEIHTFLHKHFHFPQTHSLSTHTLHSTLTNILILHSHRYTVLKHIHHLHTITFYTENTHSLSTHTHSLSINVGFLHIFFPHTLSLSTLLHFNLLHTLSLSTHTHTHTHTHF